MEGIMEEHSTSVKIKWKRIAIVYICLFALSVVVCGFLLAKTDYPDRIATKLGWGGVQPFRQRTVFN